MAKQMSNFYKSFSGADALVFFKFEDERPILYGALSTLSYSINRQVLPIDVLGHNKSRGFVKLTRYVAGTAIMTMINKHFVNDLKDKLSFIGGRNMFDLKVDEIPLFDIVIVCSNEYGASTTMSVKDVTFADEGGVVSINDILTETQFSYFARDVVPFHSFSSREGGDEIQRMFDSSEMTSGWASIGANITPMPAGNGDPLTEWLDEREIRWEWDERTEVATFAFPLKTVKWSPGDPNPIPGTTIKNNSFYITSEAALFRYLQDGIGPDLSDSSGMAQRPGNGARLTEWLDNQGLAWDWDEPTKTGRYFLTRRMITWRPGDPNPFVGVELQEGTFVIIDEPEFYKFVYGKYPPNHSEHAEKGMLFTEWLKLKGFHHIWDAQNNVATFYVGGGRVVKWKPGEPAPFKGLILRDGRWIVDDVNALNKDIFGSNNPGVNPGGNGMTKPPGGWEPGDGVNRAGRLVDWLDARGFRWRWEATTNTAMFNIRGKSYVWWAGEPNPFPGLSLIDGYFYISDEVALRRYIYSDSEEWPSGKIRFTEWLTMHDFKWSWDESSNEATFTINGTTYKWVAGTSAPIPGVEPIDGHFYVVDEKELNRFVFGFETSPEGTEYEFKLIDWLQLNGHEWRWDNTLKQTFLYINGQTLVWSPGSPPPLKGTEIRVDGHFYVYNEEMLIRDLGEYVSPEYNSNFLSLRAWLRARGHSYVWDGVNNVARFYIGDITYNWEPGQSYPLPGIELKRQFNAFFVTNEIALRNFIDNLSPPLNQSPDEPPYPRLTNWMNQRGLRYEWVDAHTVARFNMPYKVYVWRPGQPEPFDGVTMIRGHFYVTDEPALLKVQEVKPTPVP